jgi:proteasome lid subunit RPN8/RPN11
MKWFSKKKKEASSRIKQWEITRKCLSLICESAKSVYPNEFAGLLRVDEEEKNIITEVVLIPGTISGSHHALYQMHMKPVDFNIVGTVHSHPSGSYFPSEADLNMFRRYGRVHIIAAEPYSFQSWRAYDGNGNETRMHIL